MTFLVFFSHVKNGRRVPLIINGVEHSIHVEASDRTGAINHPEVISFCNSRTDETRPRGVMP